MYDASRSAGQYDFYTIVNTLTQGLRELPTDYATRVKNFLAEYLGSSGHPVPFGGRVRDFERLDAWLTAAQTTPYLLLAAPAGRGKSALLLRWCQQILARQDLAVVYFPVSIRFRTNLASVVFPALAALFASLHGEKVPGDPNTHEEVWRSLLIEYLTRPLPDGRSLLLVLDGVDEAADWTANLFPPDPPSGLRVVLSARYLANDQDATSWLQRLDWTRPHLARTLELYPLDLAGIASVLTQMGFPLDLLGTRVNIVSEMYRLSEGDPLLVRLYVDDLWERGEAVMRLRPADLHTIQPGLTGYFERWWKDQRLLWSEEAPQREVTAQFVLKMLAGALGPLSKEDIFSLFADEADLRQEELEQHMAALARFVTGDGVHQGYVFSHPCLGNYFLEERLSREEREEIERRFLTWGEQTLASLTVGSIAPEHASTYIVQYYGAHMERAQAQAPALLALVSDAWRRAWEKLDRANAGFLGDVERAWRAAEREDTRATSAENVAPYLGEEIRSLLCQASVNSVTSNISPRLMLEAVKTGVWTAAQGLACIRLITDLAPRARELVGLAPYVPELLRADILQEALDTVFTIKDEYARLDALVELAPDLTEGLLWQVLEIVPTIDDEVDRAGMLAELASSLSPYTGLIERALNFVQDMEEEECRALALEGLAPCFSEDQQQVALQWVSMLHEERYQTQILIALVPHLAARFLPDVLQQARNMIDGLSQIRLLTKLMQYLPDALQAEVVQEALALEQDIEDRDYRVEVLVTLAPLLPEEKLKQTLQEIQLLLDENYRTRTLNDILPSLPETLLPEFLQTVQTMKSVKARTKLLIQLLPRLPQDLLGQVLEHVQTIWDEGCRAELLAQFALYTPDTLLLPLVDAVSTIKDQGYLVWLRTELEAPLAGKVGEYYFDIIPIFRAINDRDDQLQTFLAIMPRLSEKALSKLFALLLPEIFSFRWGIQSEERRATTLIKLAPRLPENWLPTAMKEIQTLDEMHQVQALVALAPRIREAHLSTALTIVRAMQDREKRSHILESLVSSLPAERKGERVQEMLQALQVIKDEPGRTYFMVECSSWLSETLPDIWTQQALVAMRALQDKENQARVLKELASHKTEHQFEDILAEAERLQSDEARAQILQALALHVPEKLFPRFLSLAQEIQHERWRAQVLKASISHASKNTVAELLEKVLEIPNERERTELLTALGPCVSQDSFPKAWAAAQMIFEKRRRIFVLGALIPHAPEDFFPQVWQAIQAVPDEGWQIWLLNTLLSHRARSQFSTIWENVQALKDRERRERLLETLAVYLPARFFPQMWEEVQKLPDGRTRWHILEQLALHMPEHFFATFFTTVQTIPRIEIRGQVLETLIPRIPQSHFSQVWEAALSIPDSGQQATILLKLASHATGASISYVWNAAQTIGDDRLKIRIVRELFPYLAQEQLSASLEIIAALPNEAMQVEFLDTLVPFLSRDTCEYLVEALLPLQSGQQLAEASLQAPWEKRWQMRTLVVLLPGLSEELARALIPLLLKAARQVKAEEEREWLLNMLAPNIPEEWLKELLEALWSIESASSRANVLAELLPSLSPGGWTKLLELVTLRMRNTRDTGSMIEICKVAGPLVEQVALSSIYPILNETLRLIAQKTRREALADLTYLLPAILMVGGEQAVLEACGTALEVGCWWP